MTDDLIPNEGQYYHEDETQKQERNDDKARAFDSKQLIEELLEHHTERIDYYQRIDSITVTNDKNKFMHQVEANKLVVTELEAERNYLQELYDRYHQ